MLEIRINENKYKVEIVEEEDERLKMEDEEYHSGVCDMRKKEIYIAKELGLDAARYTVKHEIVHAYLESYGFLQVEYTDEVIADFIAIYGKKIEETFKEVYLYYLQKGL